MATIKTELEKWREHKAEKAKVLQDLTPKQYDEAIREICKNM